MRLNVVNEKLNRLWQLDFSYLENALNFWEDKLFEKFEFGLRCFDSKVFNVTCKTLVKPEIGPPGWGHQVAYKNNKKTRCQFHQNFTRRFFVRKFRSKRFCPYILELNFFGARILALINDLLKCWWNWPLGLFHLHFMSSFLS